VKVIPTQAAGCSWNLNPPGLNCLNLGLYVDILLEKGYYPNIVTSSRDWTRFFQGECDNFAIDHNGLSLIYANYGTNGKLE
jgi:hypothetical protein